MRCTSLPLNMAVRRVLTSPCHKAFSFDRLLCGMKSERNQRHLGDLALNSENMLSQAGAQIPDLKLH